MTNKKKDTTAKEKILVGVSWPYANGNIHIGHLAGQYVVCDVFARYHRLKGNDVLMVSGSDCHGAPVIFAAEEEGITPEELADKSHALITETYKKLGFLYENFTSTRTENHKIVAQNVFSVLDSLGYLQVKKSKQYYDPKVERYLPDRYVRGTCPQCGADNARGDECPECGKYLEPEELTNPYSALSDTTPILKETEHYYLDLHKAEPALKEWLKDKTYWRKWVREFSLGWLRNGLQPRCVTRDFSFGVPVPVKGWENKVIYVWIEAVVGYLSAAIEWAHNSGDPSKWENYWKNPDCKHYYFIAGGNVPFHTIVWPAEIIGYNGKYKDNSLQDKLPLPGEKSHSPLNLPYDVPANKILTYRGKKMSKGDKVGITLDTLMERYDPDVIRYFFTRYAPENQDREFIWKDFIDANNNELVANIGNFVNRVLSFTVTRFDGKVPKGVLDKEVDASISRSFSQVGELIEQAQFVKATEKILALGKYANKYFNDEEPWETVKSDPNRAGATIYNAIQLVNALRTLLKPFLPFSTAKLASYLGVKDEYDANIELEEKGVVSKNSNTWNFNAIPAGSSLNNPGVLFAKLEYTEDLDREDNPPPPVAVISDPFPSIPDDLDEQIIIGKITELSSHPHGDKIKVATVDDGGKKPRTIVCGAPNIKKGDIVPVVRPGSKIRDEKGNLHKISETSIRGITSEGMLCSELETGLGEDHSGIFILPDSLEKYIGTPLRNVRSISFEKDAKLKEIPTAWLLLDAIEVKKNRPGKLSDWIRDQVKQLREKLPDNWQEGALYKDFRALHETYSGEAMPGSAEDIIQFIIEKGDVPNIYSIVDLYNMYSAVTGISIGAHDAVKIKGTARMVVLDKDIPFNHATTNTPDIAKKGEYAYVDDEGILCRLDIKQGNRTNITKDTTNILVLFQGSRGVTQADLDGAVKEFERLARSLV